MQHLAADGAEGFGHPVAGAIVGIADEGVSDAEEVPPDLVGAAGVDFYPQVGCLGVGIQNPHMGDGRLAVQRGAEGLLGGGDRSPHDGLVDFEDAPFPEDR